MHKAIKNMKEKLLAGKYRWFEKFFNFVSACRGTIRCKTNIRMKLPVYIFDQILKIRWILIAIVLAWIIKLMIYLVTSSNDEIALLSNLFRGKSPWGGFSSCSEETCRAWKTRGNQCSRSGHERYSLIVPLNAREVSVPKSLSFVRKCSRKITRLDIFYT